MLNSPEFRASVADQLATAASRVPSLTAFVGLDGFVDEILHVVDKRHDAVRFDRVPTIAAYAARLGAAAGHSTNVELVNIMTKLGGNGPIMANALARFGIGVTYLGALGWPALHPVFDEFATRAEVHTLCGAGLTDALEFDDGKVMVGKHYTLKEINWANIAARYGKEKFAAKLASSDLVGFVNWTMLPYMSDIWAALLDELCPKLTGPRRKIFFDLADPEKRPAADIRRALELIAGFEKHFDVILGLNEKEAHAIAQVLGFKLKQHTPEGLAEMAREIHRAVPISTLVMHPVAYAVAVSGDTAQIVEGPVVAKPLITTGAGDHFNSGFCLGKLLGLDDAASLLTGVATSGYYVRTGVSPNLTQLAGLLRDWPTR